MSKNCGCIQACGCADNVITTPLVCSQSLPACPNPEECSETFSLWCSIYNGDTIANLNIQKGMKMSDILQMLVLLTTGAGCVYPTSPCLSALGFHSTAIASTTATFAWNAVIGAASYQVQYRLPSVGTWTVNPVTTNLTDSIGPLLPSTKYVVRVITNCTGADPCNSVTLEIITKS